jgi:hypothetical protein
MRQVAIHLSLRRRQVAFSEFSFYGFSLWPGRGKPWSAEKRATGTVVPKTVRFHATIIESKQSVKFRCEWLGITTSFLMTVLQSS